MEDYHVHYDFYTDSQNPSLVSTAPDTQDLIARLTAANHDLTFTQIEEFDTQSCTFSDTLYSYQWDSQTLDQSSQLSYNHSLPPPPPPWATKSYERLQLVPTLLGLDPEERDSLFQERTGDAYLRLYKLGKLRCRAGETGCWELQCPAGCWVKTSILTRISLTNPGHFSTLVSHSRGQFCVANSKKITPITSVQNSRASSVSRSLVPSVPLPVPSVLPRTCSGLDITSYWPEMPGVPVVARFPWLRTRGGPDKISFDVEYVRGKLYARSLHCLQDLEPNQSECDSCNALSSTVERIAQNSGEFSIYTRRPLLNPEQLLKVIQRLDDKCNDLKLDGVNDKRKIRGLLASLSDHSSLVMALSQQDVPYLRQLLHTALKNGSSVRGIMLKLESAIEHGYRPRGHSQQTLDLALLVYRLGGQSLLYALTQRFPIPSLRTLRNRFSFLKVAPTVGRISSGSIEQNLKTLLISKRTSTSPKRGVSLLIDETALEETAVYIPEANAVGGLCWLHAHHVDCTLCTYESALNIVNTLQDGRVHLTKEVTVVAARLFGEDGIFPLLVAPTCKCETADDMEFLLETIIDTYISSGAESHVGPLWSLATDGDATRRKCGHKIFVSTPIPISQPLFGILSNLPGLNLKTGPHLMTLDPDFKHNIKRFSTAIRSRSGIYINGQSINTFFLERFLVWVDGLDESAVQRLLHPDDPQDVPRAVELLTAIKSLGQIDPTKPPFTLPESRPDAGLISDFESLSLLGHILDSLLDPYINLTFSLSEQITSLSRLSHLLFSCFRDQQRRFIPNQLYYDLQSMIKTAMFNVAKQQLLDPEAVFCLVELGDDALELLFAFLRMCGGHNSAFNYRQVVDRLGSAQDIGSVYARNPDLHHGHRRLNLKRTESVDHISRSNWIGDIVAGHCDLPSSWRKGRDEAIAILKRSKLPPSTYDFPTLFRQGSDVDLLSVFGDGKYPSITDGDDVGEDVELSMPMPIGIPEVTSGEPMPQIESQSEVVSEEDEEPALTFEEAIRDELRDSPGDDDEENTDDTNALRPPKGPGIHSLDYLWCEKRWIHKQSVCRIVISPQFTPKSFDRLMRVRGYTHVHKAAITTNPDQILHGDKFLVGDLFISFIRTQEKQLALAVLRSTSIFENGAARSSIGISTLFSPRGNVKLTGDILSLLPSLSRSESAWIWSGSFIFLSSSSQISNSRIASITVLGHLTEAIDPDIADAAAHLKPEDRQTVNANGITWMFSDEALRVTITTLWKKITGLKVALSSIPGLTGTSGLFPYQDERCMNVLLCLEGTEQLSASRGKTPASTCPVCGDPKVTDIRSHMGAHILRASRGVSEATEPIQPISGSLPCGFCGRSGEPECALTIKVTSRGFQWDTKCPRQDKFQYATATKGSDNRPCRNVPIICNLCTHSGRSTDARPGIWRYNMEAHLDYQHPQYAHPGKPDGDALPLVVYESMQIQEREEVHAGVPIRAAFTNIQVVDAEKENRTTNARTRKRKENAHVFSTAGGLSKRSRTTG